MNIDDIPGLAEARAWEASVRAQAFLDIPREIRGVEVLPLTLYRQGILIAGNNPFLCGGRMTPEAVAVFLWVLSPSFRVDDADGRALFIARLRELDVLSDVAACGREIRDFIEEMFLDLPGPGKRGRKTNAPITSTEAVYVELFGEACGWDARRTMHTPLPQLYQVLRQITLRKDPDAIFLNRRSDKVIDDWQRALNPPASIAVPPHS